MGFQSSGIRVSGFRDQGLGSRNQAGFGLLGSRGFS